jgi:hypothetical protein
MGVAEASILLGLAIVLIAVIYGLTRMQRRIEARHEVQSQKLARNEIATIVERSGLTGWGALWTVVLFFAAIIGFFGGATATTVFQQIEASISLISTLILFGIAFAVLRKRTYSVYRSGTDER